MRFLASVWFTSKDKSGKEQQSVGQYLAIGLFSFLFLAVIVWIWPWSIEPFTLYEFWGKCDIMGGVYTSWPIFLWAASMTGLVAFLTHNKRSDNSKAEDHLVGGLVVSAFAGITEEIIFRWILFLDAIICVKIVNFLFFGWLGWGMPEWFFNHLFGPVASFFTLGKMDWILFGFRSWAIGSACLAAAAKFRAGHAYLVDWILFGFRSWAIGSARLAAAAKFRAGHAYLGLVGYINSWYIGMFLFWIMFQYGLLAAIVVHFLYDLIIFVIGYIDRVQERARGVGTFG